MSVFNGTLTYNGKSKDVIVTDFDYSWATNMTGTSYAKQRQSAYPRNLRQSDLNLELVFRTREEYLEFGDWFREYALHVTGSSQPSHMVLRVPNADIMYTVIFTAFPINIQYDDVMYQNKYTLVIVKDETGEVGNESELTGGVEDIPANPVDVEEIRASGDSAYR